jgi:hypothetical protein
MACRITLNGVFAENGKTSILYNKLSEIVGDETIAKNLYALTETDIFKRTISTPLKKQNPSEFDKNGEIKPNYVIDFAKQYNIVTGTLTAKERVELQNILVQNPNTNPSELLSALNRAFYDNNGLFNPSYEKLVQNGLYTPYEANNILNNIDLQESIKSTLDRMGNTNVEEVFFEDIPLKYADKKNNINSFGKLDIKSPYTEKQKIVQEYGGKENIDLDNITNVKLQKNTEGLQEELDSYKRLPYLIEKDGKLVPYVNPVINTNAITLIDNTQLISDLQILLQTPTELLQTEEALNYVKKLEKDVAKIGVDIVGLNQRSEYIEVIEPLQTFLLNPNKSNTETFEQVYRDVFGIEAIPQEKVFSSNNIQSLYFIETSKSEQEMFEEGFIKTGKNNIYQKIEKIPFAQLQSLLLENRTQKELEDMLQTEARKLKTVQNNEVAREIIAYKTFFGQPLEQEVTVENSEEIGNSQQAFNGNEQYLKEDFVADFNSKKIQEKSKVSDLYNDFYNNFKINEKGIQLTSEDPLTISNIKIWLDSGVIPNSEDIINYSMISRNIPNLSNQTVENNLESKETQRIVYSNNPNSLSIINEGYQTINNNFITVENGSKGFIRTPEGVFELIKTEGSNSLYTRLPINEDQNYYSLESIDILQGKDINSVNNFFTKKMKQGGFVTQKNILTKQENQKITQENFDCL